MTCLLCPGEGTLSAVVYGTSAVGALFRQKTFVSLVKPAV